MKIYIGNIAEDVSEEELQAAFEPFGQVESVAIIKDKFSGQSKGFGFIEMASQSQGQSAIEELNGKELKGKSLKVNEARPRNDNRGGRKRPGGSRSFDSGRGFGGGRGRGRGGR